MKFLDLHQDHVKFVRVQNFTAEQLIAASQLASVGQFAVIDSRAKSIETSLAKGDPLLTHPTLIMVGDDETTLTLGSGRHRAQAIIDYCSTYGISPTGKAMKVTSDNEGNLDRIDPVVECFVLSVPTRKALADYIVAANKTRPMTAAETAFAAETIGGTATATQLFKLKFSAILSNAISELMADDSFVPEFEEADSDKDTTIPTFNPTPQTVFGMVTRLGSSVKVLRFATEEQLQAVAQAVCEYCAQYVLPRNLARNFAQIIDGVLTDEMVFTDSDGDEVDGTYRDYLEATIKKPVAKKKASKQHEVDLLQQQLQLMSEALAKAGITLS
jgi:hypothetical protein